MPSEGRSENGNEGAEDETSTRGAGHGGGPPEGPPGCYTSHICSQMWCPNVGQMRRMPDWDPNVCHTYYFAPDSGLPALIIQGQPPGLRLPPNTGVCPPLAWMCP